jgi:formylglycine-generating enzyme required for sulfatase activity
MTPWWPGNRANDLAGKANVMDKTAARRFPNWRKPDTSFDDKHDIHAPLGSFGPNAFGLFDTHGNVAEWCLNTDINDSSRRVFRGGAFSGIAFYARSASRVDYQPSLRVNSVGLRAARTLAP